VTINNLYKALPPGYKRKCFLAKYVVGFRSKKLERKRGKRREGREFQSSSNWELISSSRPPAEGSPLFVSFPSLLLPSVAGDECCLFALWSSL
jgi:hypothetical protein